MGRGELGWRLGKDIPRVDSQSTYYASSLLYPFLIPSLTPSLPHPLPPTFTPSPAVLFHDAVLFGLSHETAFTETSFLSKYSFPFATTERTVSA